MSKKDRRNYGAVKAAAKAAAEARTPEQQEALRVKKAEKKRANNIRRRPQQKAKQRIARQEEAAQKVMNTIIKGADNLNLTQATDGDVFHAETSKTMSENPSTLSTTHGPKTSSRTASDSISIETRHNLHSSNPPAKRAIYRAARCTVPKNKGAQPGKKKGHLDDGDIEMIEM